jgi:hypothetical protein
LKNPYLRKRLSELHKRNRLGVKRGRKVFPKGETLLDSADS